MSFSLPHYTLKSLHLVLIFCCSSLSAGEISDFNKFAWSENTGWFNFKATHQQVKVFTDHLEGYVWSENTGWIRLGTYTGGGKYSYKNDKADNYGVNIDATGLLSGYGWGENIGWVNFSPTHSQVRIDPVSGDFDGYAWAENIGWVRFKNDSANYKVTLIIDLSTKIRPFVDLYKEGSLNELIASTSVTGNNNAINLTQDPDTGLLSSKINESIFLMRPVEIKTISQNIVVGSFVTEDGLIKMVSDTGTQVISLIEPQQMDILSNLFSQMGLQIEQQAYGMMRVSLLNDSKNENLWFATRASFNSSPAQQTKIGFSSRASIEPKNRLIFEHYFYQAGKIYYQDLYPTPADWKRLKAYLKTFGQVSLDMKGVISIQIKETTYRAIMDYLVSPSNQRLGQISFFAIGDKNNDGIDDYDVVYPNGEKQILFLLESK